MSCHANCDCEFRYDNTWDYGCTKSQRRRSGRGYKGRSKDYWDSYTGR